tara:strand:- start:3073 stop:3966 length:894 start_codon:yes stop_codon:yes gene_type:complete
MFNRSRGVNKGIILAGGKGTRLYPTTKIVSKLLLPIYDKPAIYYPLSVLMMAGISEILVISTPNQVKQFEELLGDGSDLGISINYEIQNKPEGIAQAFTIGADFVGDERVCLILGDNFFYGQNLQDFLTQAASTEIGATIFAVPVNNPSEFGVVEIDDHGVVLTLQEKPPSPRSSNAVPGLYFYDNSVVEVARNLEKSDRGEYEITDVNLHYLKNNQLSAIKFDPTTIWFDTGTPEALLSASNFVAETQESSKSYIGCIEQIALDNDYIDIEQFQKLIMDMPDIPYKYYLSRRLEKK